MQEKQRKSEKVTAKNLRALIESQYYRCALSGILLTPDNASLDHIIPLSEGGKHVISNVQWLDPRVNTMKGTMNQKEFLELCCAISKAKVL